MSVENSFRRNTMRTEAAVWQALRDLFRRLPRLLDDRCDSSQSFPNTIRLTATVVDRSIQKKRPFVTRSKQCSFDGKRLMMERDSTNKSEQLRKAVTPLVNYLVFGDVEINVVRLNVAVTDFQDLLESSSSLTSPWAAFSVKGNEARAGKRQRTSWVSPARDVSSDALQKRESLPSGFHDRAFVSNHAAKINLPPEKMPSSIKRIDPAVLAELPPDIQAEVCRTYNTQYPSKRTIDQFFPKK